MGSQEDVMNYFTIAAAGTFFAVRAVLIVHIVLLMERIRNGTLAQMQSFRASNLTTSNYSTALAGQQGHPIASHGTFTLHVLAVVRRSASTQKQKTSESWSRRMA